MEEFEKLAASVRFTCHKCGKESGFQRIARDRTEMKRYNSDPNERAELNVYCEYCGAANTLGAQDVNRTNLASVLSNFLRR